MSSPKKTITKPQGTPPPTRHQIDKINAWWLMARVTDINQAIIATGKGKLYIRHDARHPPPEWLDEFVHEILNLGQLIFAELVVNNGKTTLEVSVWRPEDAVTVWQAAKQRYGQGRLRDITISGDRSVVDWAAYQNFRPTVHVECNPDLNRLTVTGHTKPLAPWFEAPALGDATFDPEIWGYVYNAANDDWYEDYLAKITELTTEFNFTLVRRLIEPSAEPAAAAP
jgi:hypothetical protein